MIYGTADPLLTKEDAEIIKSVPYADVLEIEGASHALEDMNSCKKSLQILKTVLEHIDQTIRSVISDE